MKQCAQSELLNEQNKKRKITHVTENRQQIEAFLEKAPEQDREIISHSTMGTPMMDHNTPISHLEYAVKHDCIQAVELLLKWNINGYKTDINAFNPYILFYAIKNNNAFMFNLLVNHGANVDARLFDKEEPYLQSPITFAAHMGNKDIVRTCLMERQQFQSFELFLNRALKFARIANQIAVARFLVLNGASISNSTPYLETSEMKKELLSALQEKINRQKAKEEKEALEAAEAFANSYPGMLYHFAKQTSERALEIKPASFIETASSTICSTAKNFLGI